MKKLTLLTAILLATTTFAQIPNYVPTNGLVGWWPFNGNANDESGNGNNGTVTGATLTSDRNGVVNNAYSFDGLNSGILIPNSNNSMLDNFTISFWIKNNLNINHLGAHIWHKPNGSLTFGISGDNTISFLKQGVQSILTSNCILQNNWTHIVFTKSGDFHKLFVNGTIDNIVNLNINLSSSINQQIKVGYASQGGNNGSYRFDGNLDEFSTWNRVLSNCEIQDLYHSQLGFTTINAGFNQNICSGEEVTLQGFGGNSFSWNNGVLDNVPFAPVQSSYYILTGTDSLGCIGTDSVQITVLNSSSSSQTQTALDTYTWPVNNQTYTETGTYSDTLVNAAGCDSIVTLNLTLSYTGINELNTSQLVVSPNPTKDNFSITGLELLGTITSLEIKDAAGKVVKVLNPTTTNFSCVGLKAGVYFLAVTSNKTERVIKIIKE
jgi:hypothetical protein